MFVLVYRIIPNVIKENELGLIKWAQNPSARIHKVWCLVFQGERGIGGTVYRGMISTAVGVAREEGIRALWQGIS